jgi:hypothetical protein
MLPVFVSNIGVVETFFDDHEANAEVIIAVVESTSDVTVDDGKVEESLISSCVKSRHIIRQKRGQRTSTG